jgi:hypothetical protein
VLVPIVLRVLISMFTADELLIEPEKETDAVDDRIALVSAYVDSTKIPNIMMLAIFWILPVMDAPVFVFFRLKRTLSDWVY